MNLHELRIVQQPHFWVIFSFHSFVFRLMLISAGGFEIHQRKIFFSFLTAVVTMH